jgi:Tfp pilus assembly protein PilV
MAKMAQSRGDASRLALDYADRIRANATPAVLATYATAATYNGNVTKQTIPTTCKGKVNCAPADIALLDVAEMQEQARLLLPNGAFYVTRETVGAAPNQTTVFNVWVIWQTASTKSDTTGTLTGTNCPADAVASGTANTQCLLTRFTL